MLALGAAAFAPLAGQGARGLHWSDGGLIKLVLNGVVQATPFLDASSWVSSGGDKGMLSMAFAPDYATSRRFYVFYTDLNGNVRIDEVLRDANDPNIADPSTRRQVITVQHLHPSIDNHYGGQLQFGPDGMLYLSVGDGRLPHSAEQPVCRAGEMTRGRRSTTSLSSSAGATGRTSAGAA